MTTQNYLKTVGLSILIASQTSTMFAPPRTSGASEEAKAARKEKRRERNKESAQISRKKKTLHTNWLTEQAALQALIIEKLEAGAPRTEVAQLKQQLAQLEAKYKRDTQSLSPATGSGRQTNSASPMSTSVSPVPAILTQEAPANAAAPAPVVPGMLDPDQEVINILGDDFVDALRNSESLPSIL
jgi:hypothetical protein